MKQARPVILGLGNPLFQDEGLGIHVVNQLRQEKAAEYADLIDGGTDALGLLGVVETAPKLLVIDAVMAGNPAGTIKYLKGQELPPWITTKMSPHQISFQEVLALARLRGRLPSELAIIGVEPQSLAWGLNLSPLVAEQVPRVIELVYQQIEVWIKDC